jgi:hypothetical protein
MEDSKEETPHDEPTSAPAAPVPQDVEPQPDETIKAPKFFLSINSSPLKKEDIE